MKYFQPGKYFSVSKRFSLSRLWLIVLSFWQINRFSILFVKIFLEELYFLPNVFVNSMCSKGKTIKSKLSLASIKIKRQEWYLCRLLSSGLISWEIPDVEILIGGLITFLPSEEKTHSLCAIKISTEWLSVSQWQLSPHPWPPLWQAAERVNHDQPPTTTTATHYLFQTLISSSGAVTEPGSGRN